MPNRLTFEGLAEFKALMRAMPVELRDEGAAIVVDAAEEALSTIDARYPDHTGNLKKHLRRKIERNAFGIAVTVESTAKHAFIFEEGTKVRHTKAGAGRGFMPAADIFVPVSIQKRESMYSDLMTLVASKGLEVSGTP